MDRQAVKSLINTAQDLRAYANELEETAQRLCDHRKDNGDFDIAIGFGIMPGDEECNLCRKPACYIKGWKHSVV